MLTDFHYALRTLRKQPGFTAIAVATLAIGIGATTAMFTVVNGVLLRPLPYTEPDQLVGVYTEGRQGGRGREPAGFSLSFPDALEIRGLAGAFAAVAPYNTQRFNLTGGAEPREIRAALADHHLFRVLDAEALVGRTFTPEELREQVAILSHSLWAGAFGSDPNLIGRAIALDGRLFTVVGVMPPGFRFPDAETQLWVPLGQSFVANPQAETSRTMYLFNTVARLAPGVTVERARADLALVAQRINAAQRDQGERRLEISMTGRGPGGGPQTSMIRETRFLVVPLLDEVLRDGVPARALWVLFGAVGLVLLIACTNAAALLVARGTARRKEIAVRQAIGAGRWRIVRQLLIESVVMALIAGALGVAVSYWGVETLLALWPNVLARAQEISMDGRVLAFALGLSLLTGIAFGVVPALRSSTFEVERTLRDESGASTGSRGRRRTNSALVTVEIAVALVLLVGSGLLIKSFFKLTSVDLGYDTREVLAARIRLTPSRYPGFAQQAEFFQGLTDQLAEHPGVAHVSLSRTLPLTGGVDILAFDPRQVRPDYPEEFLAARLSVVSPGYFATTGIELQQGRDFAPTDRAGAPSVVVINTELAELLWPGRDPLGQSIPVGMPGRRRPDGGQGPANLTVIGVIGDVRYSSLDASVLPELYLPHAQWQNLAQMWVAVRARGSAVALAGALRDAVRQMDPEQPTAEIVSLEQMVSRSTASRRFNMTMLTGFAGLALMLALVGIYGVTAYAVTQRTREMGLRLAVGAGPRDLIALLLRENLVLVLLGVGAGLAGAFTATRVLRSMLYETSAADLATFTGAALLLALVAVGATYVPARRAARTDPMQALRYE